MWNLSESSKAGSGQGRDRDSVSQGTVGTGSRVAWDNPGTGLSGRKCSDIGDLCVAGGLGVGVGDTWGHRGDRPNQGHRAAPTTPMGRDKDYGDTRDSP